MNKAQNKKKKSSLEARALIYLFVIFVGVIASAWMYALNLKQTIAAGKNITQVDVRAPIEVERLRNMIESQIADSRSFFLLGSSTLFDEQRKEKQAFNEALSDFEKKFTLPHVPEIIKNIETTQQQLQDIFDQAMKFREQHTESKIVGQFYQSKTIPLRSSINKSLDEIVRLHNTELDRTRAQVKEAAAGAEVQIRPAMTWFTGLVGFLFLSMVLLVLRLLGERKRQVSERDRLYHEAQKAILARDGIIVAVSQDLKDPLTEIIHTADNISSSQSPGEGAESIKSSVTVINGLIKDMNDQAKSDQGNLTLRLDQLGIDVILDDARLMLQALAKQRDIRLQFDSVNPPTLAFFDRERVMRVLSNLVGNAIKFSPRHSKVVVKVRSDQQFVYVSVVDSGPGIPEKQIPVIFDNFWQARDTANQGSGVGLAIVKTIVEAHGGTVRVDSQVGNGSTFTFSLPRRRPVGAQLGKPAPTVKQTPRVQSQEPPTVNP